MITFVVTSVKMTDKEIVQIQNEVFTKLVIDLLKQQRTDGRKPDEYLLDKYEVDQLTKEKVKALISERA